MKTILKTSILIAFIFPLFIPITNAKPFTNQVSVGEFSNKTYRIQDAADNSFLPISIYLNVPLVSQRPELPTGCEITAIAMILQYHGAHVNKISLANEMPKHSHNPNLGYVGNPFKVSGNTIYPPALMDLVEKYAGNSVNLTGCSTQMLEEQILNQKPVVVWLSNMYGFKVHALTLVGFSSSYYYFNDPWSGEKAKAIRKSTFLTNWNRQARRAISY